MSFPPAVAGESRRENELDSAFAGMTEEANDGWCEIGLLEYYPRGDWNPMFFSSPSPGTLIGPWVVSNYMMLSSSARCSILACAGVMMIRA